MNRLLIDHVRPFDSRRGVVGPPSRIVIEGARIVEVTPEPRQADGARRIDGGGRVALPGLIDAHVHVTAYMHDLMGQALKPPSLITAESSRILRGMLMRGFTTVRDAAGADFGLQEAVAKGLFEGPRLFIAGFPVSQTGGHADMRPKGVRNREMFCTCAGLGLIGAIADGVGEVRRAVREQVRNGANQIKIMAGGGISSPSDPLEGTQFSLEELRAACEEADAANLYAMAHAYSPRAVTRAVQAGVRSIEHGNLIDAATAKVMKAEGAFLVPTLSTYAALADEGERLGWSAEMLGKLATVARAGSSRCNWRWPNACPWCSAPTCSATCTIASRASSICAHRRCRRCRCCKARPSPRHNCCVKKGDSVSWRPAPGPTCCWSRATRRASCRC